MKRDLLIGGLKESYNTEVENLKSKYAKIKDNINATFDWLDKQTVIQEGEYPVLDVNGIKCMAVVFLPKEAHVMLLPIDMNDDLGSGAGCRHIVPLK